MCLPTAGHEPQGTFPEGVEGPRGKGCPVTSDAAGPAWAAPTCERVSPACARLWPEWSAWQGHLLGIALA